jgi:predicted nucleic acid-binding protein
MNDKPFFDTNVILYAFRQDDTRGQVAETLLAAGGALSVQVLNEFVAVARRKLDKSWEEVRRALDVLRVFCPEPVSGAAKIGAIFGGIRRSQGTMCDSTRFPPEGGQVTAGDGGLCPQRRGCGRYSISVSKSSLISSLLTPFRGSGEPRRGSRLCRHVAAAIASSLSNHRSAVPISECAAKQIASVGAAPTITATKSRPIRSTRRWCATAGGNGDRRIRTIRRTTGGITPMQRNRTASDSGSATASAACRIL